MSDTNKSSKDMATTEVVSRDVKSSSKPNRKQRRQRSKEVKKEVEKYFKGKGANDLAWHSPDAELLRRSAETSWSYQTGELIDMNQPMWYPATGTVPAAHYAGQAGVLVIHDLMSCGGFGLYNETPTKEFLATQPTYAAANTLLTEMRSKARLRNTYDAPDVFMIMMAMANIYAAVIFAKRLAGTVRMFTYQNEYLPELLIRAQGFDPDWFKINQFRFVTELNVIISEINKIYVPNRMHLFELINERFSNYYTEGDSIRDQLYVITPAMFQIYLPNGAGSTYSGMVKPCMIIPGEVTNWGTAGTGTATNYDYTKQYTGDQLLNMIRRMIQNVISEPETADITGDMMNCFGENDRFYIPSADPSAIVQPVFNEEILETIHNSSCMPNVSSSYWNYTTANSGERFAVVQDATDNSIGLWDCYPYGDKTSTVDEAKLIACGAHRLIDVHRDPSPEKTFAITRMRNALGSVNTTSSNSAFQASVKFGADLICAYSFWTYIMSNGARSTLYRGFDSLIGTTSDLVRLEAFHYRPMQISVGTNGVRSDIWCTGETDIWAQLDASMLTNMNRISLLSLLGAYNNI